MVIWITGLSGAGKTTLCNSLYNILKPAIPELLLLDGDTVRAAFRHDVGHSEDDRKYQVKRMQGLTNMLSEQGIIVIVALVYSHPELLLWNRDNIKSYYEVYLDASLDLVKERDSKGLYAKAMSGDMKDVVGIDIPWNPPENPDVRIDMNALESPEAYSRQVIDAIPYLKNIFETKLS